MKHFNKEDLIPTVVNKICSIVNTTVSEGTSPSETKKRVCSKLLTMKKFTKKEIAQNPHSSINMELKYWHCKGSGRLGK